MGTCHAACLPASLSGTGEKEEMFTAGTPLEAQPTSGLVGTARGADCLRRQQSAKTCPFLTSKPTGRDSFHSWFVASHTERPLQRGRMTLSSEGWPGLSSEYYVLSYPGGPLHSSPRARRSKRRKRMIDGKSYIRQALFPH